MAETTPEKIEVVEWSVEVKRTVIRLRGEDREPGYSGTTVYEQRVSALDLHKVIKAVNGIA